MLMLDGCQPPERIDDHEYDFVEWCCCKMAAIVRVLECSPPCYQRLVGKEASRKYQDSYRYQQVGQSK